jgi:hypothetical protein
MNRFGFLFASVLLAACTDETSVPPPRDWLAHPVRDLGIVDEPMDDGGLPLGTVARYGTPGHDEFRDVVITPDRRILIAGFDADRGVVLEYKSAFVPRAVLDTVGTDTFESIALDHESGRIWLAGRTNAALPGLVTYGSFDFVAGDLSDTGFRPMVRGFDTTPEYVKQIAVADGLVAVAGYEQRLMQEGPMTMNPVVATYAVGDRLSPLWMSTRRNVDAERYTTIDVSATSVVVGGTIEDGEAPGMFVTARDRDAGMIWSRRTSAEGSDELAGITLLPNGNVLWAGTTTAALGEPAYGRRDIVVGEVEGATGGSVWIHQFGTEHDHHVADLSVTDDGHIYIAGDVNRDNRDVFLMAIKPSGEVLFYQEWPSVGDDVATAVAVTDDGAVVVGYTDGDLGGTPQGGRDGFMIVTAR